MASQFQLIMRTGPTPGAAYTLEGDQLMIGRDSTNEIVINDAEVSRRHARLTFQGGKYVLEDLGSTNGTFVNGQRLAGPRVLKAGEVVSFGEQIVLVFEVVSIDPGATVMSPRAAAGSIPENPVSVAPVPVRERNLTTLIIIGVGTLAFFCLCGAFFWWVDATFRWCVFFPFISGC